MGGGGGGGGGTGGGGKGGDVHVHIMEVSLLGKSSDGLIGPVLEAVTSFFDV